MTEEADKSDSASEPNGLWMTEVGKIVKEAADWLEEHCDWTGRQEWERHVESRLRGGAWAYITEDEFYEKTDMLHFIIGDAIKTYTWLSKQKKWGHQMDQPETIIKLAKR